MKLSKQEIKKAAEIYRLGNVKKALVMNKGWVNFSYEICTDKGGYIVQILGGEYGEWKKNQMKLQFAVLNHLRDKNFPYEIPLPILNLNKEYISDFGKGRYLWVYKKIEGEIINHLNKSQFSEIFKALALLHKYVEDFNWSGKITPINFDWALEGFKRIEKIAPKTRTDRFVLKNIQLLNNYIDRLSKIDFNTQMQVIHADFNNENILFHGNKLVGILDFGNIEFAPLAKDLAIGIMRLRYPQRKIDKKKIKLCLDEYRKYAKFSQKEEKLITPLLVGENCGLIRWFYWDMKKHLSERYKCIVESFEQIQTLTGWLGWEK
jgi:Ser/Thr protein kinase RdoA (MazF antagonist)